MNKPKKYWLWGGVIFLIVDFFLAHVTSALFSFPIYFLPTFPVVDFLPYGLFGYRAPLIAVLILQVVGVLLNGAIWGWLFGKLTERFWTEAYAYNKRTAFLIGLPLFFFGLKQFYNIFGLLLTPVFFLISWLIMMSFKSKSAKTQLTIGVVLISLSLTAISLLSAAHGL